MGHAVVGAGSGPDSTGSTGTVGAVGIAAGRSMAASHVAASGPAGTVCMTVVRTAGRGCSANMAAGMTIMNTSGNAVATLTRIMSCAA